ncbi:uncharacterized protein A1O9_00682 [Exophiala aquamarina CBS 119918]|uniref:Xylanolytic transcriptional activator regulatory domain-containing protein n=1 Tax=Exophiala aquamarina CBS 119918 TaxID=1182545 RepID=A0A072PRI8_9EURO|nr:uncharacterized protein A1O9_00682 [Exophiala aquamarina CBS 119918]KEF62709.1 hypothetical protein A1O9_00682 [Exophiala aquamarina CBS 119918]
MNRTSNVEPDEEIAWSYCAAYFDNAFESVMGVVYRPDFEARLRSHFQQRAPQWTGDVAWYALRNIMYAAVSRQLLLEDDSIPFADAHARSSQYFENVLAAYTELLFSCSSLDAVRALIALAFYLEATANGGSEHMVCATVVRLVQAKGLHQQPSKILNLPEVEVLHRNWLFWAIYCCEKLISFRSDRPSAIDDSNISCEIPKVAPPGSTINVQQLTHMIKAALLSQRISHQLCSVVAFRRNPSDLMKLADELYGEVEAWKENVKDFPPPGKAPQAGVEHPNRSPLHMLNLQYMYYAAIQSVYAIFGSPWISSILGMDKNPFYREVASTKASKVVDAARSLIMATRSLRLTVAVPQWASFYFPMSGLINLFIHILSHPTLPSTDADLALLDIATALFSHIEFLASSDIGFSFARQLVRIPRSTVDNYNDNLAAEAATPLWSAREQIIPEQLDYSRVSRTPVLHLDIHVH